MKTISKRILILLTAFSLGTAAVHITATPVLGLGAPRENMPFIGALEKVDELGYTLLDAYQEVKECNAESVRLLWDHKGKLLGFSVATGLIYSFGLAKFVPVIKFVAKVTVIPATVFFGWPIAKVCLKLTNEWMVKPFKKYFLSTPHNKVVKTGSQVDPKAVDPKAVDTEKARVDTEKARQEAELNARLKQLEQQEAELAKRQEAELAKRQEALDTIARDSQKARQEAQLAAQAQQQVTPRASGNNRRQAVRRGKSRSSGRRR